MDLNILSKKKIKEEVLSYKNAFKKKKIVSRTYLIFTIILLSLTLISLALIYLEPDSYGFPNGNNSPRAKMDWAFIIIVCLILGIMMVFCPLISYWYIIMHKRIQVHIPIILSSKTIDVCAIIVGIFNFVTAILAAAAPIILGWSHTESRAWNADTKVIIYVILCSIIFLFWAILIPVLQDRLNAYDNQYFSRFIFFEFDKINIYLRHLKKMYPTRVKEFNESLLFKKVKSREQNNVINEPVKENTPFSWHVRRVFKNKVSRYGNEYDIIKYILFIQIFSIVYNDKIKKAQLKDHISRYVRGKNPEDANEFNKNFNKFIKDKI